MLNKWLFISLKLFIISVAIKADEEDDAYCTDVAPMEDFDDIWYTGEWYAYARMDDNDYFDGKSCLIYITFPPDDEKFKNIRLWREKSDDSTHMLLGYGQLKENGQGENLDGDPFTVVAADDEFLVWAVVLGCGDDERLVWILTRDKNPDEAQLKEAKQVLSENGISFDELSIIDQSSCPDKWTDAEREEIDLKFEEVEEDLQYLELI